jgi:hypothetical protein
VLILTGTPIKNRLDELFPSLTLGPSPTSSSSCGRRTRKTGALTTTTAWRAPRCGAEVKAAAYRPGPAARYRSCEKSYHRSPERPSSFVMRITKEISPASTQARAMLSSWA